MTRNKHQIYQQLLTEQRLRSMPGGCLADPSDCDVYAITAMVEAAKIEQWARYHLDVVNVTL